MSRSFRCLLIFLALSAAPYAGAGTYRVQFAGIFDPYCSGDCAGSGLEALAGTAFSGEFVFPDAGVDLQPGDPEVGVYAFTSLVSQFRFDSEVDVFDVSGEVPVRVYVLNCIGWTCPYSGDVVNLGAEFGGFHYDLGLANFGPELEALTSDVIPGLDVFQGLAEHPYFSIATSDYGAYMSAGWDSQPDPLTAGVTAVPAPPAAWLLLSGLAILVRRGFSRLA